MTSAWWELTTAAAFAPHQLPRIPGMCHPLGASMRTDPVRAIRSAAPAEWAGTSPLPGSPSLAWPRSTAGKTCTRSGVTVSRSTPRSRSRSRGSLDHGSIDREVALMPGETVPGVPEGPAPQKVRAFGVALDVLRDHGSLRRAEVVAAVREAGHDYSERAIRGDAGVS